MTSITKILIPLALLLGAWGSADAVHGAEGNADVVAAAPGAGGERGGRLARLDVDKDGAISLAEAQGSRLADKFAGLDADKDGKLTREELRAGKHGKRGEGRHGGEGRGEGKGWHDKDPAERAAKMMEKRDADKNGALSAAEVAGSRLAEKFAEVDADKNGALSKDELVAFKAAHHGRGPAPR